MRSTQGSDSGVEDSTEGEGEDSDCDVIIEGVEAVTDQQVRLLPDS
jgi:hypothetical protein